MQLRRLTALTTAIIVLAGAAIGAQAQKAGDVGSGWERRVRGGRRRRW